MLASWVRNIVNLIGRKAGKMAERICKAHGQQIDKEAVSVWDEEANRNVCGLCGSSELEMGYGLAGGGGCGPYNFCHGCNRVLDKSEDKDDVCPHGYPLDAWCDKCELGLNL